MRILFVEDDPMNRLVVKDMLTVVGVTMAEAEDAETGLRMIEDATYDAVLMDLRMPGMDGLTAIDHIRARNDSKSLVPIIVITADTGIDLHQRCRAHGADHVLGKPVPMEALFDTLSDIASDTALLC